MNRSRTVLTVVAALLAMSLCACDRSPRPPLEVHEALVYAPLPGTTMSAAYMVLENTTDRPLEITRITSPDFAATELHETLVTNGVARMQSLSSLRIPANASVPLREGGKHVMLMRPHTPLSLGDTVSIRIHFGDEGLVLISTPLRARLELETSH